MPFKFVDPLTLITLPPPATASILAAIQRLDAVRSAMQPYAKTREGKACLSACDSIATCVQFSRRLENAARVLFEGLKKDGGALQYMTKAAIDSVPERVAGTYADRASAVKSAEGKALADAAIDSFVRAQEQLQTEADLRANQAVAAMREVRDAVLAAESAAAGPLAFREKLTLDDISQLASIREAEAKVRAPSELARTFEGLIVAGDQKREQIYASAVEPELRAIVAMAPPRLRERLGVSGVDSPERRGQLETERNAARTLLDRIKARAEERIPESLQLARYAEQELRGIFIATLGQHALAMSPSEYSAFKSGNRDPMQVDVGWPVRIALASWAGR